MAREDIPPTVGKFPLPGSTPAGRTQFEATVSAGHRAARVRARGRVDIADASTWLVLLLLGDLAFIAIHILWLTLPAVEGRSYALDYDRGHAEFYQYTKELWIMALFGALLVRTRALGYAAWVLVFAALLVDDAVKVHETLGARLAGVLPFTGLAGLNARDLGETAVAAAAGAALLALVAWSYVRGSAEFRRASRHLALLLLALGFFGIGIDLLHALLRFDSTVEPWLLIAEDGGEMLVMSVIVWYVFLLHKSDGDFDAPLAGTLAAAARHARTLLVR